MVGRGQSRVVKQGIYKLDRIYTVMVVRRGGEEEENSWKYGRS